MAEFRCIVTTHNDKGQSCIAMDRRLDSSPVYGLTDFWHTASTPASLNDDCSVVTGKLEPPQNGTLFRFFQIPPNEEGMPDAEVRAMVKQAFDSLSAGHCLVDTKLHPLMHKTKTIDYVVLLQGTVTLLLDDGEVALEPFDTVVQRGTNHSWINKGKDPALLIAVLVDAK